MSAVVAHELGHVWIFTHHPYLQTEQLANQIAMRLVARETLEPIYEKLWKRLGVTGDLSTYLGSRPPPSTEALPHMGQALKACRHLYLRRRRGTGDSSSLRAG